MSDLTLRLGSVGPSVIIWQGIVKVTPDGSFGPDTQAATIAWQKAHKLNPDGVVGPISWATSRGEVVPKPSKTASAPTDLAAYNIAKSAAPTMPEAHRQYALSVSRGEGFFGRGWTGAGVGSKNWGAVQGTGPAGSFQTGDSHADGSGYIGTFKRYNTDQEGFLDMAKILLKPNVTAALDAGNLHDAVYAQHDNRYFELAPDKYLSAVMNNYGILTANLEWQNLLNKTAVAGIKLSGIILGLLTIVGGGIALYKYGYKG